MTHHSRLKRSALIIGLLYAFNLPIHAASLDTSAIKSIVLTLDANSLNQQGLAQSHDKSKLI